MSWLFNQIKHHLDEHGHMQLQGIRWVRSKRGFGEEIDLGMDVNVASNKT